MLKTVEWIALILVVVGAVNWGLVGLFGFDLVAYLFGGDAWREATPLSRVVYAVVGLAGLLLAATTAAVYSDWRPIKYDNYQQRRY